MNTTIFDCCNDNDNDNRNSICQKDPVSVTLKSLENDLCDIKVSIAETKTSLVFLAQLMCNNGFLNETEKILLLNLENGLKTINSKINDSYKNVDTLECLLR
ncbi:MAG: hypothetical protein GX275_00145 [Clostridiales bacterium]|nr:hypothetical protein [Clostridiales bacterium]